MGLRLIRSSGSLFAIFSQCAVKVNCNGFGSDAPRFCASAFNFEAVPRIMLEQPFSRSESAEQLCRHNIGGPNSGK